MSDSASVYASPSLWSRIPVYAAFMRIAFLEILAYRLRYVTGILTYLLFVSVHYFIWSAVYANQADGSVINGFTLPEMITYITIGWVSRSLYFSNIDEEIDDLVRSGQISLYLLRPVSFQFMMLSHAIGQSLFRLFFFTAPIALVVFGVYEVQPPASLRDGLLFLLVIGIGFFMLAFVNFLIGMLAFSFKSIDGVMRSKYYLVQLLSGLLLPLSYFPKSIETVLSWLPFQALTYLPLKFYLGKIPEEQMLSTILFQVGWVIVLGTLGVLLWKRATAKLTIQGG